MSKWVDFEAGKKVFIDAEFDEPMTLLPTKELEKLEAERIEE